MVSSMLVLSDDYLNHDYIIDGYPDAVPNRTVFPISNGVINLNSEHPTWTGTFFIIPKGNQTD